MLVLSRKIGESIIISKTIRITIGPVQGNRVRLAIDVPGDVQVDWAEVHARRQKFVEGELEPAGA